MASSLLMLIAFRALQGLAGGGLQPSSQAILLDAFPREKQGTAMTIFGVAALLAPVVGPTLGGYLTDNYNWRWIFFLNVPVGLAALLPCRSVLADPDYLRAERVRTLQRRQPFDALGLCLLCVTMVSWEIMLSKGQEWDWLGDPFLRVQTLLVLFLLGLSSLIYRQLRIANPLINFRTLSDRNFGGGCIMCFFDYALLYVNSVWLSAFLHSLVGCDASTSGLVLSPSGVAAVMMLFVVGGLLGRGFDARFLIAAGLFTIAAGYYWLAHFTLEGGTRRLVWPGGVVILGHSRCFDPLHVCA